VDAGAASGLEVEGPDFEAVLCSGIFLPRLSVLLEKKVGADATHLCLLAAVLSAAAAPARADQDAVQFFRNIDVTPDAPAHDAVCFFCSVRVEDLVTGDIVVFFGNVRLNGAARHDVVDFFGHVSASDNSSISGDLVSLFGAIRLGENVTVGEDMVAIFSVVHTAAAVRIGGDRVALSPWIVLCPLLVFLLIVIVVVHELRARRRRQFMQSYPLPPQQ